MIMTMRKGYFKHLDKSEPDATGGQAWHHARWCLYRGPSHFPLRGAGSLAQGFLLPAIDILSRFSALFLRNYLK